MKLKKNKCNFLSFMITVFFLVIVVSYSLERISLSEWEKIDFNDDTQSTGEPLGKKPLFGIMYTPTNPIVITDNDGFTVSGFTGSGTPAAPYVLDNYSIINSTANLIRMQDTDAYFVIRNCSFNGLAGSFAGVSLLNVSNGIFYNNTIYNCTNNGIRLSDSEYNNFTENTIYNISGTFHDGIRVQYSDHNIFVNNTIYDCSDVFNHGIEIYDSHNNSFLDNNITQTYDSGISVSTAENNTFIGNIIYNCSIGLPGFYNGIDLIDACYNNSFIDNTIAEGINNGIRLGSQCHNNTFTDNRVYNTSNDGFVIADSDNNTFSNNELIDCSYRGFYVTETSYNTRIVNNSITSGTFIGILLYDCADSNIIVADNNISFVMSGIRLDSTSNNTISDNTIYNCSENGIELYGSGVFNNSFLDNRIFNCSLDGFNLILVSNNTFSNNTIYKCTEQGFHLDSSSNNNTFFENDIYNCTLEGFFIEDSNNNTIFNNTISNCSNEGITLRSAFYTVVSDNIIKNCWLGVNLIMGSFNNTIAGNTIYNCPQSGVAVIDSENNSIVKNNIYSDYDTGLAVWNSHNNTFIENIVYNITINGIALSGSNDNNFLGNVIYNCTGYGIELTASSNNNFFTNNTIYECSGIVFSDGIYVEQSRFNTFIDNYIHKSSHRGIHLYDGAHNNTFLNNTIHDCDGDGIYQYLISNSTFIDNLVYNCIAFGIRAVYYSNYTYISGNEIFNCSASGIYIDVYTRNTSIVDNTVYNCSMSGITLDSPGIEYTNVSGNTVFNCISNGISLWFTSYNYIVSNIVYNCSNYGIYVRGSSNNTFSNNEIYDCADEGFYLENSNNNTFSNNTIYDCYRNGIIMDTSSNNSFINNEIYNCSANGFYLYDSYYNDFLVNNIYNCSGDGIRLFWNTSYNSILNNDIYNCSNDGIYLDDSSNNEFIGNQIFDCGRYGFTVTSDSDSNNFTNNVVYNNTNYGLYILSGFGEDNIVMWNDFYNNNGGGTQGYYLGGNNNVSYNYWDDWTSPDILLPFGIVDNPYSLDGFGNEDSFPLTTPNSFLVIIITPLSQYYTNGTITVALSGFAISYYWYYIEVEDISNQTWTGSANRTLTDGTYTLHAYGNNTLGNITHTSVIFTIDTIPPTINITNPINGTTYLQNSIILNYTVSDGTVTIYINEIANSTARPSGYNISSLLDIEYNITAISVDQAGNIGQDIVIFTVDATAPTVNITSPLSLFINQDNVTLTYNVSDGVVTIYINDLANVTALPSGSNVINLLDIGYNITIVAVDPFSRIGKDFVLFTIDTIAPTVNVLNPINTTYSQLTINVNYTISDGVVTIYFNDLANVTAIPNGSIVPIPSDGSNNITIIAVDQAGNIGMDTVIFTNDLPHTISGLTILTPNIGVFAEVITIIWKPASDTYGHAITYDLDYSNDNGNSWSSISSSISGTSYTWDITDIPKGSSYRVRIIARCSEGTEFEVQSSTFSIDNDFTIQTTTSTSITPGWSFPLTLLIGIFFGILKKWRSKTD